MWVTLYRDASLFQRDASFSDRRTFLPGFKDPFIGQERFILQFSAPTCKYQFGLFVIVVTKNVWFILPLSTPLSLSLTLSRGLLRLPSPSPLLLNLFVVYYLNSQNFAKGRICLHWKSWPPAGGKISYREVLRVVLCTFLNIGSRTSLQKWILHTN